MQEQQTQEIIVQSTRGAHGNGHEHMEQENPREADGNVVFSPLPHFFKTSSGWGHWMRFHGIQFNFFPFHEHVHELFMFKKNNRI
jgi:hypothetical protein